MTDAGSRATPTGIPEITIGTRIAHGSYDITIVGMASGGMGLVAWGPNQINGGVMQAVKLPRPDRLAAADPQRRTAILADFEQEALTWCHLWMHPCIVTAEGLLRLSALGGLPGIFLQYAPEGSLRDMLHKVHLPGSSQALGLEAVFAWGQMIASALATIHQPAPDLERPEPLVHCDLKPENVLLSAKGWAMLTDLGLTRALASLADTTTLAPDGMPTRASGAVADGTSEMNALSAEQRAQVEQLRRLFAQAGVTLPSEGTLPAVPTAATPAQPESALYSARTIYVSSAEQAALAAALTSGLAQPAAHNASPHPALPATTTQVIAQMGSRGTVAGTPPYMPPEQWLGLDAVEPASDVYALGVLLFELFAGVGGRAGYPHTPDPLLQLSAGPFAAWCAAHTSGPSRRLSDPEVRALSSGSLVKLVQEGQRTQAEAVLAGLDALIGECLKVSPAARPAAKQVQERLAALAKQAGLEPLTIPAYPRTPEREADFWENLGITYTEVGQPEKRLPMQRKAIVLDPGSPQRQTNLGNALNEVRRAEQRKAKEAAAQGDHTTAQRLMTQERAYREEAVAAYLEAEAMLTPAWLTRYPYLASKLPYNLGATLGDLGRYAEAAAATERALAADPTSAMSHRNLALIYLEWSREAGTPAHQQVERLERGLAAMRQALVLAPHYGGGQELLAMIQRELAAARRNAGSDVK